MYYKLKYNMYIELTRFRWTRWYSWRTRIGRNAWKVWSRWFVIDFIQITIQYSLRNT